MSVFGLDDDMELPQPDAETELLLQDESKVVAWAQKSDERNPPAKVEDGWYAAHPECPGVWGHQDTADAAYEEFCKALEDWAVIRFRHGQPAAGERTE